MLMLLVVVALWSSLGVVAVVQGVARLVKCQRRQQCREAMFALQHVHDVDELIAARLGRSFGL